MTLSRPRHRWTVLVLLATASLTAIVAAGCGGSSKAAAPKGSTGATPSGVATDPQARALRYVNCLRAHGLQVADPNAQGVIKISDDASGTNGAPPAGPPPGFVKAQAACEKYAPSSPPINDQSQAQMAASLLKFARCMRANGVSNYPDPKVDNGNFTFGGPGFNPNSLTAQKATGICQKLLPQPAGGSAGP